MTRKTLTRSNAKTINQENKAMNTDLIRDDFDDATVTATAVAEPAAPAPVAAQGPVMTPAVRKAYNELLDHTQDSLLKAVPTGLQGTALGDSLASWRMMLAKALDKGRRGMGAFIDMVRVTATIDALDAVRLAQQLNRNATWKAATMDESVERRETKERAAHDHAEDRPGPWGLEGQRRGTEGEWQVNVEDENAVQYTQRDVVEALTHYNTALYGVLSLCLDEYSNEKFLANGLSFVDVKLETQPGLSEWTSIYDAETAIARQRQVNDEGRKAKQAKLVASRAAALEALAKLYG